MGACGGCATGAGAATLVGLPCAGWGTSPDPENAQTMMTSSANTAAPTFTSAARSIGRRSSQEAVGVAPAVGCVLDQSNEDDEDDEDGEDGEDGEDDKNFAGVSGCLGDGLVVGAAEALCTCPLGGGELLGWSGGGSDEPSCVIPSRAER